MNQQLPLREIEQMAADYYEEWGWDKKTGAPSPRPGHFANWGCWNNAEK